VQGLGLCVLYSDILRLSFLLVVVSFYIAYASRFDSIHHRYPVASRHVPKLSGNGREDTIVTVNKSETE
jgi:hypothetical protein